MARLEALLGDVAGGFEIDVDLVQPDKAHTDIGLEAALGPTGGTSRRRPPVGPPRCRRRPQVGRPFSNSEARTRNLVYARFEECLLER
jgi:hypothetical protein